MTESAGGARAQLLGRGARRWYFGALVSLAWLGIAGAQLFDQVPDAGARAIIAVLLVAYGLAFAVLPPAAGFLPDRSRFVLPVALWALSLAFWPYLGWEVYSLWVYVGVAAAMIFQRMLVVVIFDAALVVAAIVFAERAGVVGESLVIYPLLIGSVSLMMAAFARQIRTVVQLRQTQHELARLAVAQERNRVARDMHDILGHSLTVITVKAELAGRLLGSDTARAGAEIAEVEELARGALADVRSTVAGYRGVSVLAELANARSALESAGIRAELPSSVDAVPAKFHELFGWVVREGVTNVVRHSQATWCSVTLGSSHIEVVDDGLGPAIVESSGTGLTGLRERVQDMGARMTIGRAPGGGFSLRVSA